MYNNVMINSNDFLFIFELSFNRCCNNRLLTLNFVYLHLMVKFSFYYFLPYSASEFLEEMTKGEINGIFLSDKAYKAFRNDNRKSIA